ncbi:putative WD repeat-containing protein [Smittium mucronatum]|uniref:Putative WD repeat-containing protein n=1 Tax=Smittium mucronatum TaxID=133383 RepID=A0A1R0GXF0_9FUNG|nr:putative WD repeat-containing protein [Smittium mucronatum]
MQGNSVRNLDSPVLGLGILSQDSSLQPRVSDVSSAQISPSADSVSENAPVPRNPESPSIPLDFDSIKNIIVRDPRDSRLDFPEDQRDLDSGLHIPYEGKGLIDTTFIGTKNIISDFLRGIWGTAPHLSESPFNQASDSSEDSDNSDSQNFDENVLADANIDNPEKNRPVSPPKFSFYQKLNQYLGNLRDFSDITYSEPNPNGVFDPVTSIVASRTGHTFTGDSKDKRRLAKRTAPAPKPPQNSSDIDQLDIHKTISVKSSAYKNSKSSPSLSNNPKNFHHFLDSIIPNNPLPQPTNVPGNPIQKSMNKLSHSDLSSNLNLSQALRPRYLKSKSKGKVDRILVHLFLAQEIQSNSFGIEDHSNILVQNSSVLVKAIANNSNSQASHNLDSSSLKSDHYNRSTSKARNIVDSAKRAFHSASKPKNYTSHNKSQDLLANIPETQSIQGENYNRFPQFTNSAAGSMAPDKSSTNMDLLSDGNSLIDRSSILGAVEPSAIWNLSFSKCGRYVATGGQGGILRVWRLNILAMHEKMNSDPDYSPVNFGYELFEPTPYRVYYGHKKDILCISWSKNGLILSASMDRTVKLWHLDHKNCLKTFPHTDAVTSVSFHPANDQLFISGGLDGRLRLWSITSTNTKLYTDLPENQIITAVSFSNSYGDQVVVGTYLGLCVFYSMPDLKILGRLYARSSSGRRSRGIKITGISYLTRDLFNSEADGIEKKDNNDSADQPVNSSQDSSRQDLEDFLIVSSNDSRVRIYSVKSYKLVCKLKGHVSSGSQAFATVSDDGKYAISGSEDHNIYVWPLSRDNLIAQPQPKDKKFGLRLSFNGKSLFAKNKGSSSSGNNHDEIPTDSRVVSENSNYEYFNAHDHNVSAAVFAPLATLLCLANNGDPILSKQLNKAQNIKDQDILKSFAKALDMTSIIVSADFSGIIRVFRKDLDQPKRPVTSKPTSPRSSLYISPSNQPLSSLVQTKTLVPAETSEREIKPEDNTRKVRDIKSGLSLKIKTIFNGPKHNNQRNSLHSSSANVTSGNNDQKISDAAVENVKNIDNDGKHSEPIKSGKPMASNEDISQKPPVEPVGSALEGLDLGEPISHQTQEAKPNLKKWTYVPHI